MRSGIDGDASLPLHIPEAQLGNISGKFGKPIESLLVYSMLQHQKDMLRESFDSACKHDCLLGHSQL
jgi:hypothetical protein